MYELLEGEACFGIRVGETCVPDISPNREAAQKLLWLMQEQEMDELHIYDVIEDWLAE